MEKELKIICDLSKNHNLESNGWNGTPDVAVYKASQYEIFDKVTTFVFCPKLN